MKYLDFLGRLNELTIVDIPHYIADKTLTQTINRIELDIGNEQLLEKVENICDIKQKIKQSLYDCSLNGASIVYLEKLTNGNVIIKMENIAAIEDIIYNGDEIVGVKLRKTITVDKDIFIVETLFDTQQVSNKFYGKSEMEGLKEIDTEIFTTRIPTYSYIAEV
jgi:hypothetical protein